MRLSTERWDQKRGWTGWVTVVPLVMLTCACPLVLGCLRDGGLSRTGVSDADASDAGMFAGRDGAAADLGREDGSSAEISGAPTKLRAQAMASDRIDLLWNDNSGDETAFRVERRTDEGASWTEIGSTPGPNYSDVGLAAKTTYAYRVLALSEAGRSASSNVAEATTPIAGPPAIRADHPRLWFTVDDLPRIRQRIQTSHQQDWNDLLAKERGSLESAFVYVVTKDASYAKAAIASAMSKAGTIINVPSDKQERKVVRSMLFDMAYVFDWCYPALSVAQKEAIGNGLLFGLRWLVEQKLNGDGADYLRGAKGHGYQTTSILAAIALIGENFALHQDYRYTAQEFFEFSYTNMEHGWWPRLRRMGLEGGGWPMSWMYSGTHLRYQMLLLSALSSASGHDYFRWESWARHVTEHMIYGIDQVDDQTVSTIMTGDQGWPMFRGNTDYVNAIILAGAYDDPRAVWFANRMEAVGAFHARTKQRARVHKILWYNYDLTETPITTLPKSRAFHGVGKYVIREGWDPDDLWAFFKNMPYYLYNHNHRANGHFALTYKRGHLAIDSGFYDTYESSHHNQYYTQAVAHNTLLIGGNQSEYGWNLGAYDTNIARTSVYEHTDSYTCIVADYTDSCATVDRQTHAVVERKAEQMVRYLLYLRQVADWESPVLVIFDRAIATDPSHSKRWLLHSVNEPQIDGLRTTIIEGQAKLFVQTLDHSGSSFAVSAVGSNNTDVFDGSHFQGWDYQERPAVFADSEPIQMKDYFYPGKWRIEVKPTEAQAKDLFLHVLAPASSDVVAAPSIELIESTATVGVKVSNRLAVFAKQAGPFDELAYQTPVGGEERHLVTELVPNVRYAVTADGSAVTEARTSRGGVLEFSATSATAGITYRVARVR